MRFLHPKWNPHLLAISVIELCLSCLPLRATETSNRVVVDAADVDLAKAQSGGEIVFVFVDWLPSTRSTATAGRHSNLLAPIRARRSSSS